MALQRSQSWIRQQAIEFARKGTSWTGFFQTLNADEQKVFLTALNREIVKINKERKCH